jgi:hypothetical protein
MWSNKNLVLFFAGAAAFHTISHLLIGFSDILPITIFSITLTEQLNFITTISSAILTLVLVWWASQLK